MFGGAIFIASVIVIPQRFQVVNDLSAFNAGWRLLALMLCSPMGTVLSGLLVTKVKIPPLYIFLVAAILQTIGLALMGTLSVSNSGVPSAQYGYQAILGLGIGLTLSLLIVAAPTAIEEKDTGMFTRSPNFCTCSLILTSFFSSFCWRVDASSHLGRKHWLGCMH